MRLIEEGFQQYHPRVMPLSPRDTIATGPQRDSGEGAERAVRLATGNGPEVGTAREMTPKDETSALRGATESLEASEAGESGVAPNPPPPSPAE